MIEVTSSHKTVLVVEQRGSTTTLQPLPTGQVIVLADQGGLPGPRGPEGDQGIPGEDGQDGAAQIPEVLDGGNF